MSAATQIGFPADVPSGARHAQTNASQRLTTLVQLGKIEEFLEALDRLIKI